MTFKTTGVRTNLACFATWDEQTRKFDTSKCSDTPVELEVILEEYNGKQTVRVINGITGYESFYLSDLNKHKDWSKGFSWCAGTPCRWDRLWSSGEAIQQPLKEIDEQLGKGLSV